MRKAFLLALAVVLLVAFAVPVSAEKAKKTEAGLFDVALKVKGMGGLKEGKNIIELKIVDAAGAAVEGAQVEITPWMPTMNHGTPWFSKVNDLGRGKYRTNIPLTMGGHWEFRITVKIGDKEDKVVFTFPNVKGEKGAMEMDPAGTMKNMKDMNNMKKKMDDM